jgi:hypothetical protein
MAYPTRNDQESARDFSKGELNTMEILSPSTASQQFEDQQ